MPDRRLGSIAQPVAEALALKLHSASSDTPTRKPPTWSKIARDTNMLPDPVKPFFRI
jgi:hypothetical protein